MFAFFFQVFIPRHDANSGCGEIESAISEYILHLKWDVCNQQGIDAEQRKWVRERDVESDCY